MNIKSKSPTFVSVETFSWIWTQMSEDIPVGESNMTTNKTEHIGLTERTEKQPDTEKKDRQQITDWFSSPFTQKMHLLTQTNINNLAIWMEEGKKTEIQIMIDWVFLTLKLYT